MHLTKIKLLNFLFCFLAGSAAVAAPSELAALKYLPLQDAGRVKPFDTFARESMQLIYGRGTYGEGKEKRDASEIVFTWIIIPSHWDGKELVQLRRLALKEDLKLDVNKNYFTPTELISNDRLPLLLQALHNKQEAKDKLNPYDQDVQRLENQLGLYRAITTGMALHLVPPKEGTNWLSLQDAPEEWRTRFSDLAKGFAGAIAEPPQPGLQKAVDDFIVAARAENPALYADQQRIETEVHFNGFHPFQWAWIAYLTCLICLGWAWIGSGKLAYRLSWVGLGVGFLLHTYGFILRCYLAGRPPVSNMYESVVWVSFGAVLFGIIFEAIQRRKYAAFGAAMIGVLCLIVADLSPNILDASIHPLEPVLRSNLWLTVHVLTITLSYSAFFLALLMGDVGLFFFLRGQTDRGNDVGQATYRVVQVGTVLLAAGTILGGVWADYSWGRFWGWDPKETWALIALLGYLAVLHAKKGGLVRGFGFCAGCVIAFTLVMMAWYGVNFVLGVGLHSYGFSSGGTPYVAAFVGLHMVYVAFATSVHRSRQQNFASRL